MELTETAQYAHAVGEYFIFIGQFVKVTSAIAVGDTIAVGTNVAATTVGAVLKDANDGLAEINSRLSDLVVIKSYNVTYTTKTTVDGVAIEGASAPSGYTFIGGYTNGGSTAVVTSVSKRGSVYIFYVIAREGGITETAVCTLIFIKSSFWG